MSAPLFPIEPGRKKPDYGTNDARTLLGKIPSPTVEAKLDEVLAAVKEVDNLCDFERCKARTSLMGQQCKYCKKKYCIKHCLPEIHGCGEAVKEEERKNFMKAKPLNTVRHEQDMVKAKKKLNAKLKDMQVGRMPKANQSAKAKNKKK